MLRGSLGEVSWAMEFASRSDRRCYSPINRKKKRGDMLSPNGEADGGPER